MNNTSFKRKFTIVLLVYTILILLLWLVYHNITFSYTQKTVNDALVMESDTLIEEIETKLSNMKTNAALIGSSSYVKEFLTEKDTAAYYEKATMVHEIISKVGGAGDPLDGVVTINNAGEYYRFIGGISNRAIEDLRAEFGDTSPVFTIASLDGRDYFCYISPVYSTNSMNVEKIGDIIIVNSLTKTRRLLANSSTKGIDTAVASEGVILFSTSSVLEGKQVEELGKDYRVVYDSAIEDTNLSVVATVEKAVFDTPILMFQMMAVLVGILFVVILTVLYRYLSRVIINPLLTTRETMHMELLGTQMDAHFVVNTLHTIEILLQKNEIKSAEQVTYGLTEILKNQHSGMSNVFVELSVLEHYIGIMNIRYHEKFRVDIEVDEELAEYVMQGFMLQPIVENAFTHGFSRRNSNCAVTLRGSLENRQIVFEISDNGIGIAPFDLAVLQTKLETANASELPEQGLHGVALINIQKRIQAKHGAQFGVWIQSRQHEGTTVTLRLPAIQDDTLI